MPRNRNSQWERNQNHHTPHLAIACRNRQNVDALSLNTKFAQPSDETSI